MKHRKNRKFKTSVSIWLWIALVSMVLAVFLNPLLKFIYPLKYESHIEECAEKYNLDKYLVMGIISAESNFNPDAVSKKDAYGIMQIKEETALWCLENLDIEAKDKDIHNPKTNITIGCAYMQYLINRFDKNVLTAVAAYNAGPGNVEKWLDDTRYSNGKGELKVIPFSETSAYVQKVQKRAKIYKKIYAR